MINLTLVDEHQIVVPVRFRRATTGFARRDAPEIDDRGFKINRPSGWPATDARGPIVGIYPGSTVKIKVVREDIDDDAPLFVTAENRAKMQIIAPPEETPLPADGIFQVKAVSAGGNHGKLMVRLGSKSGPILAEIEPKCFSARRINIRVHNVRIDRGATRGTRPNLPIERLMNRVRAIWWPTGLHMRFDAAAMPVRNDNIALARTDEVEDPGTDNWAEVKRVLSIAPLDADVHCYIIDKFTPDASGFTTVGIGVNPDLATRLGCPPGILVTADGVVGSESEIERTARTIAHEIGHFLDLAHVHRQNSDNPARDTYSRRHLMYPLSTLEAQVTPRTLGGNRRFNNVGYGDRVRGWLLTMKNHPHHSTDGECATARARAATVAARGTW